MASKSDSEPSTAGARRNGKLSIPLPFDEAIKAALKVKPPKRPRRKPPSKTKK
jgi:hypothetical protein